MDKTTSFKQKRYEKRETLFGCPEIDAELRIELTMNSGVSRSTQHLIEERMDALFDEAGMIIFREADHTL